MQPYDRRPRVAGYQDRIEDRLRAWQKAGFSRRLWAGDPTLWTAAWPAERSAGWPGRTVPELADRLGWLSLPETMGGGLDDLADFARGVAEAGTRHVVLLGMGGSSMAPEVFQHTFGPAAGAPALIVLDSTHPSAVRRVESQIDLGHTLFLVSSKSGTTTETLSLFRYFWRRTSQAQARPGGRFVAITDPGTPLERLAREREFCRTFLGRVDVGGRYSALSAFGLVPAALIGVDVRRVLGRAQGMAAACGPAEQEADNPGLVLGAALGELALAGRDKVTFLASPSLAALPAWIEQLVAESTGKDGKGIVPVVDEPMEVLDPPARCGADRAFVYLRLAADEARGQDALADALDAAGHPVVRLYLAEMADIGAEFFRWEVAVAAAGSLLGIHPFNQPDVQLAKELAGQAMARQAGQDAPPGDLGTWAAQVRPGDYVGLQAYLAPDEATSAALVGLRHAVSARWGVATTLGYGPRFLHSTGQLHKGGPDNGAFIQFVDDPGEDLDIPETGHTFGRLISAQAMGDLQALRQRGRRVVRVGLGRDIARGLTRLKDLLGNPAPA